MDPKNSLIGQTVILLFVTLVMSCSGQHRSGSCNPERVYLSITAAGIAPPLITEFMLNNDGSYWLYRNGRGSDTIRGNLNKEKLSEIMEQSGVVQLPTQNAIVSDGGVYQLDISCLEDSSKIASYEGLSTLSDQTRSYVSSLEQLIQEIGKANQ